MRSAGSLPAFEENYTRDNDTFKRRSAVAAFNEPVNALPGSLTQVVTYILLDRSKRHVQTDHCATNAYKRFRRDDELSETVVRIGIEVEERALILT
jgi:hypothetical protein